MPSAAETKKIIRTFRELLDKLGEGDTETARGEYTGESLFLEDATCPTGLMPCDETTGECPDEGVWPKMYTKDGLRCYTRSSVAHKRSLSKKDKKTAVSGIRALVEEVARTQRLLGELREPEIISSMPFAGTELSEEEKEKRKDQVLAVEGGEVDSDLASDDMSDLSYISDLSELSDYGSDKL